jgi:hypothetical protein
MSERETVSPVMAVEAIFVMFLVARFLVSTVQVPRLPERVIVGVVSVESNDLSLTLVPRKWLTINVLAERTVIGFDRSRLSAKSTSSYPWDLHSSVLVKLRQY